ncbi:MAG: sugar transferase [Bacteroidota bacterium]
MKRPSKLNSLERKSLLVIGDLLVVITSLNLLVNHAIDEKFVSIFLKISVFSFGIITYLTLSYILDFYNLKDELKRRLMISKAIYISFFFVFLVFMFLVIFFDASFWRLPLLLFLIFTPVQIGLWRLLFVNVFRIISTVKNVVYVYDSNVKGKFKQHVDHINGLDKDTFHKVKLTYSIDEDGTFFHKKTFQTALQKIDTWILNISDYGSIPKELEDTLLASILEGKEVLSFTSFYENIYEAMPIRSDANSFYELLQLRNKKIRYLQVVFSMGVNFLLSFFVGIVFFISCPFVWFFNLFFNQGPLFYSQLRVGQNGNEFKIYKFRTMVVDAEKEGAKMASKNDNRITPFGKVLRTFRIDELPQIISVIQGKMTFIGPRPERKVFVDQLNEILPFYGIRHLFKPGITGWAQVKYKYGEDMEDSIRKLEYDLYYIKNKSITLDLRIIFKTVTTVLFSRGV